MRRSVRDEKKLVCNGSRGSTDSSSTFSEDMDFKTASAIASYSSTMVSSPTASANTASFPPAATSKITSDARLLRSIDAALTLHVAMSDLPKPCLNNSLRRTFAGFLATPKSGPSAGASSKSSSSSSSSSSLASPLNSSSTTPISSSSSSSLSSASLSSSSLSLTLPDAFLASFSARPPRLSASTASSASCFTFAGSGTHSSKCGGKYRVHRGLSKWRIIRRAFLCMMTSSNPSCLSSLMIPLLNNCVSSTQSKSVVMTQCA
mmetsp:Transcript_5091/g.17107  ORF Transcript_5091/g.17107 Transcript_5091/m.17107 type:complete len:262 (-) Transcript_5091:1277-2062(-)